MDDPTVVLEAALRYLEARQRSVHEVRRRLTDAGYRPDLVDAAITRLGDLGILDDATFARAWVESRDRSKPRGARALRQELALRGVERSVVDAVLADRDEAAAAGAGPDPGDESDRPRDADEDAASRLLARHARALQRVADPRQRRQRAYALLARNGFDPETAARISATILRDAEPDGSS